MPSFITQEFIMSGQSAAGGWNRKQIELLDIKWPPQHGWIDRVVGKEISTADAERFRALRGKVVKRKPRQEYNRALFGFMNIARDRLPTAVFQAWWEAAENGTEPEASVTRPDPVETQDAAE